MDVRTAAMCHFKDVFLVDNLLDFSLVVGNL